MPTIADVDRTNWLQRIVASVVRWRQQQVSRLQLESCDPAEVEQIARDLGMPGKELQQLSEQSHDSADLLHHRLALLQIDPNCLDVTILRDLERCCSSCRSKARCRRDLAGQESPDTPKYCPNQQTLDAVRIAKCH